MEFSCRGRKLSSAQRMDPRVERRSRLTGFRVVGLGATSSLTPSQSIIQVRRWNSTQASEDIRSQGISQPLSMAGQGLSRVFIPLFFTRLVRRSLGTVPMETLIRSLTTRKIRLLLQRTYHKSSLAIWKLRERWNAMQS